MITVLNTDEIGDLVTLVEEAARSTEEGIKHFVEPAPGTLRRATSRRHHIVFGRRGSGKTSLLKKAAADLTVDRHPIAYVDLEAFKGHSYPDVLLSVLISTFNEFRQWMDSAAIYRSTRTSFWRKFFDTTPKRKAFNRIQAKDLSRQMAEQVKLLKDELHRADGANITATSGDKTSTKSALSATSKVGTSNASIKGEASTEFGQKASQEIVEKFNRSKIDFLHRHILEYQELFLEMGKLSEGDSYLFLDDLYHIKRIDQAQLVDYFHRIAKGHRLWLKLGTIRHRTLWYVHGDPPTGMKLGDDADEIDLDLTLEKYSLTKKFLVRILSNFAESASITPITCFLTEGAVDRLVLASGGVARDFLSIFRRAVDVAREREGGHRGEKVGIEDINVAAGENDTSKREEFKRDTLDDTLSLEEEFRKLREFCLDGNNTNCFLLDKEEQGTETELIRELVDLKLVHLVRGRVTVSGRLGRTYEGYMLDLSEYAGSRKRRKLKMIEFWKSTSKEALRKASLIYTPASERNA